jgi:hypothetical protein
MPERTRLADAEKSKVRSVVEHVFAHQEEMMGLFVRTIGRAQARLKIDLANLAYNMRPTCAASSGSTIDAFPARKHVRRVGLMA